MKQSDLSQSNRRNNKTDNQNVENLRSKNLRSKAQKDLDEWRNKLKELSFEDSLRELDTLLSKLQNDEVPLADLQAHYLQGKAYLAHCQELLDYVEQELVEVNLEENNSS